VQGTRHKGSLKILLFFQDSAAKFLFTRQQFFMASPVAPAQMKIGVETLFIAPFS
jgi:hypothetical protein